MALLRRRKADPSVEIVDMVRKALPQIGGSLTPTAGPGSSIDLSSIASRMAIGALGTMTQQTPEDIVAALEAQGLAYTAPFAPGRPLDPYAGYDGDPRLFAYTVGQNISTRPRWQRIPFDTLKGIIDAYDVAQVCIRHLTNDIRSLPLQFAPLDGVKDDVSADLAAARDFWRKPDKRLPFKAWVAKYLHDVLRYDAGCLYRQRTYGGDLHALKVVSGTTIAPLLDYYGDTPEPPAPAYVQFVNGLPWKWLNTDDLIYVPMNPQSDSMYGMAPIEGVMLTANTDVRFQWHFLNYFTEGSVPEGFMEAPPDLSSPEQVEKWQAQWDAIMLGDQAQKHQIRWVPAGANYTATKDTTFDEAFPLYLMRRVCAAYGVTPNDLGFTESVNRATGDTQIDVQWRVGTKPIVGHLEDIMNDVTQNDLGLRIQVTFDAGQEKEDRLTEAQAHQLYVFMGAESPEEVRENVLGLPTNPAEAVGRFVMGRGGLIPLRSLGQVAGEIDAETGAPVPGTVTPLEPGQVPAIAATPFNEQAAAATTSAIEVADAGDPVGDETTDTGPVEKGVSVVDLRRWRANSRARVKKNLPPRRFPDLSGPVCDAVWEQLKDARTYTAIDQAFHAAERESVPFG